MTGERKKFKFGMTEAEYKYFHEQGVPDEQMKLMYDVVKVLGEDGVARLLGRQ